MYIANLIALQQWYRQVRRLFISERFPETLMLGLKKNIRTAIKERIKRLETVCQHTPENSRQKPELSKFWLELKDSFQVHQEKEGDRELRDKFLESVTRSVSTTGKDYIAVIQGLATQDSEKGIRWLQGIVDGVTADAESILSPL